MSTVKFIAEQLLDEAKQHTGIDVSLDVGLLEALSRYCDSINEPTAQLTEVGVVGLKNKLKRFLSNNLRMARDIGRHPEILDQKIAGPLVVSGAGRSGTTKLQKVLAASGDFNFLPLWQGLYPALLNGDRSESPKPRIEGAKRWIEWNCSLSPHFMEGHPFDAESADEELFVIEQSLRCAQLFIYCPAPSYLAWIAAQDVTVGHRYLRRALQYLQWQGLAEEGRSWLLKSPMHTGYEDSFVQVFPDAKFVMPHRDPTESSSSAYRMVQSFRDPYSTAQVAGELVLNVRAAPMIKHLEIRKTHPSIPFLDLDYREVVGSSDTAAAKVYDFIGETMSDAALQRMQRWEADNPKGKHGKHTYSLESSGNTAEDIKEAFAPYIEFLSEKGFLEKAGPLDARA